MDQSRDVVVGSGRVERTARGLVGRALSRRALLKGSAVVGAGAGIATLLAACGGSTAPTATTTSSTSTATTGGTGASTQTTGTTGATPTTSTSAPPGGVATPGAAQTVPAGTPGGTLNFGLLRDPIAFDPHIAYGASSASLQGNVYDTLVTYDQQGNIVPSLASSWEIQNSSKTYVFHLQSGVTFHDGTALTADDVVYTFDRIRDSATAAELRQELANLDSYTATDSTTVTVNLKQPYSVLLSVLASQWAYIVSKAWGQAGNDFKKKMNGTGPFKLGTFEPQVKYTLVKNDKYWVPNRPYLDQIVETVIADDTARMNAFKSGQINFVEYVPWQNMDELSTNSADKMYLGYDTFNLVRLNPQKPPLDKPEVRQALNFAIDRKACIDVAFGGKGQPITVGLIPPGSFWYNQQLDGHWTYDTAKATSLLQQVGLKPSDLKLSFDVANISVHSDTAQAVQSQLQKWGATVTIVQQDVPTLTKRRSTGDYQMMMDGLGDPWPDPDFYTTYFGKGGASYAAGVNFDDPKIDALLDQGRTETDNTKRKAIYAQVEQQLFVDAPFIFILWRPQVEASIAGMQGYSHIPGIGLASERFMLNVWFKK
ncbi:MAG TPA: ABC transporter substrate-binding protein [Thermomicrobiaceae bacterium]|nr:ABC transporter substrate-binding protein [Thermomicrobiaceae bacterium]